MSHKLIPIFILMILLSVSCRQTTEPVNRENLTAKQLKEPLIKSNKYLTRSEKEDIDDYVKRYNLDLKSSGTGLLFHIENKGKGSLVKYGNRVTITYTIHLLTGEKIYDSELDGKLEFVAGKGGVPAGLEEGIIMMKLFDRAKLILPSHLAYGLLGDSNRIPPRSVLVYDIEIVEIQ